MSHRTVAIAGALAALCVLLAGLAFGQAHHHPPEHAAIHEQFYQNWYRPDQPHISCCNKLDCAPAEARMVNGQWIARKYGETVWYRVPPEKVELNRDSPDGRNHLCVMGDNVWCFVAGAGG